VRSLEDALLVLQKAQLKVRHAFHVSQHHGHAVAAVSFWQRRIEDSVVCYLEKDEERVKNSCSSVTLTHKTA